MLAEQFGTLTALHPDRIDLGIGRGPGTFDESTARALRRGAGPKTDPVYWCAWRRSAHPFTAEEWHALAAFLAHQAHGTPETVVRRLTDVADATGADELMLATPVYALAARLRSYELVRRHATTPSKAPGYSAPDSKSSTK